MTKTNLFTMKNSILLGVLFTKKSVFNTGGGEQVTTSGGKLDNKMSTAPNMTDNTKTILSMQEVLNEIYKHLFDNKLEAQKTELLYCSLVQLEKKLS